MEEKENEQPQQSEQVEQDEQKEQNEQNEQIEQNDQVEEQIEQIEQNEQVEEQKEQIEQNEQIEQVDQNEPNEQVDQNEQNEQNEQIEQNEQNEQVEQNEQNEQNEENNDQPEVKVSPIDNNERLFDGEYEKLEEKEYIGDPNYKDSKIDPSEDFNSNIIPKRKFLYKILITRPKGYFEEPLGNLIQDKNSSEEQTAGNNEVKGVKSQNDYPCIERPYIEMGFQTANSFIEKSFQVTKKEYTNSYTQVEENLSDIKGEFQKIKDKYMKNPNQKVNLENFMSKVKPRMEQALQSNETINIFMNDFDLDKYIRIQSDEKKNKNNQQEIRTFRDNSAGNKAKKEKSVHWIASIKETDAFIAHSLMRNFTFDERIKVLGIPYQSQILFWNIKDVEQNSPIFAVETQSEVTCFEFDKYDCNNCICALSSGQIMFIKFKDILGTLRTYANTDYSTISKKIHIKDYYIYNISSLHESHKGRVIALKWLPPGYALNKKNQVIAVEGQKEVGVAVSLGEDGQIILWDYKGMELGGGKSIENEVNPYIKAFHVEINKVDCK